ncbi:sigma-70 family RNA polymerase sigma factor [Bosea sp. BK604]|uniref:sigma-70 family RNA polymerase sigma factor n=1 Tax=Bosea sp. BK604 TaxID=2512180 RepID=UPI00104B088F|nr:sigma-70 family RNA polymerase sigma factor [Bosea sp. BK604]TCR69828.1 RNA polymerase sigma-70 factor (ECF subfamily) [Bosea sp. BK604]
MATSATLPRQATEIDAALRQCASGDKIALKRIYEAESARMLGVAQRLLKRRALAEEAVQDAFVLIWRHAARFDPERGSGLTWIYAILRNRALSILRDEKRTETSDTPVAEETASEEDDPETVMSKLSDAKALRACLEQLPEQRRSLVLLAFVQGLTHGELAERVKLPLGTVKSWIRRSLLALKECLG